MAFFQRVQDSPQAHDRWGNMWLASEARYFDGLALADAVRHAGAVYLLGYVVEMLLKVAFFRLSRIPVSHDLWAPLGTGNSPMKMAHTHAQWTGSNLHDLKSWFDVVSHERGLRAVPPQPVTMGEIQKRVLAVQNHWSESLRYKPLDATVTEKDEMIEAVSYIKTHQQVLWS